MEAPNLPVTCGFRPAWNKGRIVGQKRPQNPVRFEISEGTRASIKRWMQVSLRVELNTCVHERLHSSPRQYALRVREGSRRLDWARTPMAHKRLWHTFDAQNKSNPNLLASGKSARGATFSLVKLRWTAQCVIDRERWHVR